jgi:hypothetical protein
MEYGQEPELIDEIGVGINAKAHDVLVAIYRNPRMPPHTRMRAAIAAIPFESPKLAVTASVPFNETFANLLDRATKRSAKVRVIAAAPIEDRPEPEKPTVELTPYRPPATLDIKRFRRRF